MKAAATALFLLGAGATSRQDLFPTKMEGMDREVGARQLAEAIQPCFTQTGLSGYARILTESGKSEARMDRQTYKDRFIESCLMGKVQDFVKPGPDYRSWTYAHVVSECQDKKKCQVTVVLNNFAENAQTRDLIESHWTGGRVTAEETAASLVKSTGALIELLKAVSK